MLGIWLVLVTVRDPARKEYRTHPAPCLAASEEEARRKVIAEARRVDPAGVIEGVSAYRVPDDVVRVAAVAIGMTDPTPTI